MTPLDSTDLSILRELQANGRISNAELARRVRLSAPPCLRRVQRLEKDGFIKGYRALLDEKQLGYEVTVFAMVHLETQTGDDIERFKQHVDRLPLVRECWLVSGEFDFLLKCVAQDMRELQSLIGDLTAVTNVRNVRTLLTWAQSKDLAIAPL